MLFISMPCTVIDLQGIFIAGKSLPKALFLRLSRAVFLHALEFPKFRLKSAAFRRAVNVPFMRPFYGR